MKQLARFLCFLPLLVIVTQLLFNLRVQNDNAISPTSKDNDYLNELTKSLQISKLQYQQMIISDHRREIEFYIVDRPNHSFKVIISRNKNPLTQVGALQKLIKIANIESKEISFVDLSSKRPYATF